MTERSASEIYAMLLMAAGLLAIWGGVAWLAIKLALSNWS